MEPAWSKQSLAEESQLRGRPRRERHQVGEASLPGPSTTSSIKPHQGAAGGQPYPAAETRGDREGILHPIGPLEGHLTEHGAGSGDLQRHRHSVTCDPDPAVDRRERARREGER